MRIYWARAGSGDNRRRDSTFDQMRRKRHRVVYEASGRIGATEAEQAIAFARVFLVKIRGLIQ